jgi:Alpha-glutamyl/putrescinyl thymine pyrophosphorylase clade 2
MEDNKLVAIATEAQHDRLFAEFCRWEKAVGGPDPHMALAGELSAGSSPIDRAWQVGCYLACYNVPTGITLWTHWPYNRVSAEAELLEGWLREHWEGLAFRRERRAVRSPEKLARHLVSLAIWLSSLGGREWVYTGNYEQAWRDADQIYGVGRYIKLKLLEALRRYTDVSVQLTDLRASGGWSPREALCLLYPACSAELLGNDSKRNCIVAERCAKQAQERLAEGYGIELDAYELQVLLCDYKQSYVGKRQFPGRSQDSEIAYYDKIADYWGLDDTMFQARARLFPHKTLGEICGWRQVREELGDVVSTWGYTWSDLQFDYLQSREHLAEPVRW